MSSPAESGSAPPPPQYVAIERPRRSPFSIVWLLVIGMFLGGSCVTCARTSFELSQDQVYGVGPERVGVVEVVGTILDPEEVVRNLRTFARRDDLDALVVRIDSPGGTVAPSQEIFDALRYASERKPVVASMGTVAASGGFWAAMGADWIVAEPGTITGSIGVVSQAPDLRGIADKVGFGLRVYKSGEVKDLGNPFREMTPEDDAVFNALVDDIHQQFIDVVATRRGLAREAVMPFADGRIFSGRRALEAGFVDEMGGLHQAARRGVFLAKQRSGEIGAETSTTTGIGVGDPALVYPRSPTPEFLKVLTESAARAFGRAWAESWGGVGLEAPVLAR